MYFDRTKQKRTQKGYYRYGYYWGPNWSGGQKVYGSIDYRNTPGAPTPIDWNDRSAAQHDAAYAREKTRDWYGNPNLEKADYKFAWRGLRAGFHSKNNKISTRINDAARGIAGAAAVGTQGLLRRFYRYTHPALNRLFDNR